MNLHDFDRLATRARQAPPIQVDVEHAVLRRLAETEMRARRSPDAAVWSSTFAYLAGASALAASFVGILAVQAWSSLTNPLADLMNFLVMIP